MSHLEAHDGCDLEATALEDEGGETCLVMRPAHLAHPNPTLDLDVGDLVHLELEYSVREERLVTPRLRRLEAEERRLGRGFGEDEGRRAEITEPFEEPEQFRAPVVELREDFERLEGVEDNEVDSVDVLARPEGSPQEFHPWFRGTPPNLLLNRSHVEDMDIAPDGLDIEAHRRHLVLQALPSLLEGNIQALRPPLQGVPMEDRVAQCRFHGAREARDQDDVADRESAAQNFVEPVDERWDLLRLHLRLPPASPCDRNAARPSEPIELPIEVRVRTNSQHLGESEGPDAVDGQALVVAHRADPAVRAAVADLRSDGVVVTPEGRVAAVVDPSFVGGFRIPLARLHRVVRWLERRHVGEQELPEARFLDGAQEERRVAQRFRRSKHAVHEELDELLEAFLSRGHGYPPFDGSRGDSLLENRLDLFRGPLHRHQDESEVRVVVHKGNKERFVARADAQELPVVRLDDRPDEATLRELDRRHLRGPDDRGGHRRDDLRVHAIREGVRHHESIAPHDRGRLDVGDVAEFVNRLFDAAPKVRHAITSAAERISAMEWIALSTLRRMRPMFASFRSIVTRMASSPAPVAIIFPMCVSTIDWVKDPRPISTAAISEVPTIAAAIAAIFFGSITLGSAWAMRMPSLRAIVTPMMSGKRRSSASTVWSRLVASIGIT